MPIALSQAFCNREAIAVARDLLGCTIVCRGAAGVIVETEAYHESEPAAHSYRGRTTRNAALFGPPGTCYVYFTYGMHWCSNVVTGADGEGAAVLLRSLVPIDGIELMRKRRSVQRKPGARQLSDRELCSGPAKLVQALGIEPSDNGRPLVGAAAGDGSLGPVVVRDRSRAAAAGISLPASGAIDDVSIAVGPRIGISVATDLPWRFGVAGSRYMSKPFPR